MCRALCKILYEYHLIYTHIRYSIPNFTEMEIKIKRWSDLPRIDKEVFLGSRPPSSPSEWMIWFLALSRYSANGVDEMNLLPGSSLEGRLCRVHSAECVARNIQLKCLQNEKLESCLSLHASPSKSAMKGQSLRRVHCQEQKPLTNVSC